MRALHDYQKLSNSNINAFELQNNPCIAKGTINYVDGQNWESTFLSYLNMLR